MSFLQNLKNLAKQHGIVVEQMSGPGPDQGEAVPEDDQVQGDQTQQGQAPQEGQQGLDPNNTQLDPNMQQPADSALPNLEDAQQEQEGAEAVAQEHDLMLIRLIYKALTIDLDPSQYTDLLEIKEINQNNADQVLGKLQQIIDNY